LKDSRREVGDIKERHLLKRLPERDGTGTFKFTNPNRENEDESFNVHSLTVHHVWGGCIHALSR